jgi:Zinc finger, C3HC4 type (RING finger)
MLSPEGVGASAFVDNGAYAPVSSMEESLDPNMVVGLNAAPSPTVLALDRIDLMLASNPTALATTLATTTTSSTTTTASASNRNCGNSKGDDVKNDDVKNDDVKNDDVRNDDVKNDDLRNDDDSKDDNDDNVDADIAAIKDAMERGRQKLQNAMQAYVALSSELENKKAMVRSVERAFANAKQGLVDLLGICYDVDACRESMAGVRVSTDCLVSGMEPAFERLHGDLRLAQKRTLDAASQLQELADLYKVVRRSSMALCPICLGDDVQEYVVPCGHTFCSKCLSRNPARCYVCRAALAGRHSLYFA